MQRLLEQVDLADLLAGGVAQRVLDGAADLLDELAGLVHERHAAEDHLGVGDRTPVLLGDRRDDDEDPVGGEHPPVAQRYVGHVADLDAVDEDHPGLLACPEARPARVEVERDAVVAAEDVLGLDPDGFRELRRVGAGA